LRAANPQTGAAEFVANVGYDPAWREAYYNHFIKPDYLTASSGFARPRPARKASPNC
jgi:hypothetical protein